MEHIRARNFDPLTSWMAAESAKDLAKRHAELILKTLKEQGPLGKDGIAFFAMLNNFFVIIANDHAFAPTSVRLGLL